VALLRNQILDSAISSCTKIIQHGAGSTVLTKMQMLLNYYAYTRNSHILETSIKKFVLLYDLILYADDVEDTITNIDTYMN
jgi:hypothetical protein